MNYPDYFKILDLHTDASIADIKRAYRIKVRMYHPDLNPSPEARDKFIQVTEAYEFLIANFNSLRNDEEAFARAMEDWRKYRQHRSGHQANAYARASNVRFRNSNLYKTRRVFDLARIIFGLTISVLIIIYTILGFIAQVKYPEEGYGNPVFVLILMILLGLIFISTSLIYLKAYLEEARKHKKK
jgi:hypothetical protein